MVYHVTFLSIHGIEEKVVKGLMLWGGVKLFQKVGRHDI